MRELTVKWTKQLQKDLGDLKKSAEMCEEGRLKKTLDRVSRNLHRHLGLEEKRGGMADLNDPAIYNISGSGLIQTGQDPIDAGSSGTALLSIPPPFTAGTSISAGAMFSPETLPYYMPPSYSASGGRQRRQKNKMQKK